MASFDVFDDVQDHELKVASVHIDRVVSEAFVAGIDRTADPSAQGVQQETMATDDGLR